MYYKVLMKNLVYCSLWNFSLLFKENLKFCSADLFIYFCFVGTRLSSLWSKNTTVHWSQQLHVVPLIYKWWFFARKWSNTSSKASWELAVLDGYAGFETLDLLIYFILWVSENAGMMWHTSCCAIVTQRSVHKYQIMLNVKVSTIYIEKRQNPRIFPLGLEPEN